MEKFRAQQRERKEAQRASRLEKEAALEAAGEPVKPRTKSSRTALEDNLELRHQRQADATELLKQAELLGNNRKKPLSAKQKQILRTLVRKVRVFKANVFRLPIDKIEKQRAEIAAEWKEARTHPRQQAKWEREQEKKKNKFPKPVDPNKPPKVTYSEKIEKHREEERQNRMAMIKEEVYDPTKPYATPWRPRPYMSAFAFIPRYLEVNHKICSAVYLRHPVAKPGLTEVPTPFPAETQQLAFTWYLRRR